MSLTSARVSCKCGKVVLKFFNPQPRICLECGCCDCRQALQWAEEQGGPKVNILTSTVSAHIERQQSTKIYDF